MVARETTPPEAQLPGTALSNEAISVLPTSDYSGLGQYVRLLPSIAAQLRRGMGPESIVILRMPEPLSVAALIAAQLSRSPTFVNVVADPTQIATSSLSGIRGVALGHALRILTNHALRTADATYFVTETWLQQRLAKNTRAPSTHRSNVRLSRGDLAQGARVWSKSLGSSPRLITVGSLQDRRKGVDILLAAMRILSEEHGLRPMLSVVGDGAERPALEKLAVDLGVAASVTFLGHIQSPAEILQRLDEADLFVLASRGEGLPRSAIEALARGLPSVLSRAGGCEELVSRECIVNIDDASGLATAIHRVVSSRSIYADLSAEALNTARAVLQAADDAVFVDFLRRARAGLQQ